MPNGFEKPDVQIQFKASGIDPRAAAVLALKLLITRKKRVIETYKRKTYLFVLCVEYCIVSINSSCHDIVLDLRCRAATLCSIL